MKSVASTANFACPMFVCSFILIIVLLQPLPAKAQDFTYPEGTMEELLQQVDLFSSNPENVRQGYFVWIFLVPGSYHTERLLMAPEYREEVASYSITNAGSNEFCVTLNVSHLETVPTQDCLSYTSITSVAFVDDFLGLRADDQSSVDSVSDLTMATMLRRLQLREPERAGAYLQFLYSAITGSDSDSSTLPSILTQINVIDFNGSIAASGIYRYQREYFCLVMVRGSEGAGREFNYCIPYTNLAAVRDVYSYETSGRGFHTPMEDFLAREYGDVDPTTLPLAASELSAEEIQSILTNWQLSTTDTDLLVSLRIPTRASLTVRMSHEFREGLGGELQVLSEVGDGYFCFVPWTLYSDATTPITPRPGTARTCIMFANIAGIEEVAF